MLRDGSAKLPFTRQIMNKEPSQKALNTSMREYDQREEVYMSMVIDEADDDTDQREATIRAEILANKVETLVDVITGGGLIIQDGRGLEEDMGTGTGTGARKKKNQFQRQFQNQSMSEQLRELIDIPTICLIYKSLLRYVSIDNQAMGAAREEDQKA